MKPLRKHCNPLRTRSLRLEQLESREYLSATPFDPSPIEMELLERINQMRIDPQGELARIFETITNTTMIANDSRINSLLESFGGIIYPYNGKVLQEEWKSLTPVAPVAWSSALSELAQRHTEEMINVKRAGHIKAETYEAWLAETQYALPDGYADVSLNDNIFASGRYAPDSGYGTVASYIHECLAVDFGNNSAGHRLNIMDPDTIEVGISVIETGSNSFGPFVSTFVFSTAETQLREGGYLLGLIYDDANGSNMYEAGEGLSGMTVKVEKDGELIFETTTLTAGAYQEYLPNGHYSVTVSGDDFSSAITKFVTIDGANAKLDFQVQDLENQKPALDLNGPEEGVDYFCEYTEHSDPAVLVSGLMTLVDSDNELLNQAVIKITNNLDGYHEMLNVNVSGTALNSHYDSETSTLTISGLAPIGDYIKVLKTLTYQNLSDCCALDDRIVEIQVSDGSTWSETATTTVRINPASVPMATIEDVRVIEGDDDSTELVFVINLTEAARREAVIDFVITPGTAVAAEDYELPSDQQIIIPEGESSTRIVIKVKGDYDYDYLSDLAEKTLTLEIQSYENLEFANTTAQGIIQEDDKIEALGAVSLVDLSDIAFLNGCRRLYSFQPQSSGRVSWDAYVDALPENVRLTYYVVSHENTPQASSSAYQGRQHLEFDVTEGYVYVLKVEWLDEVSEGESPTLDRLVMRQILKKTSDDWFEIDGESTNTKYTLDLDKDRIGMDDSWLDFDRDQYPKIRFIGNPGNSIEIIGGGTGDNPVTILPDGTIIDMDGVEVDVSGFELVEFYGTESEHNAYHFVGTDGDDMFLFKDGNATLITSDNKVFKTYNVNEVTVDGKGGYDTGRIYDTMENDTFLIRSGTVSMTGGGYHIETQTFNDVTGISATGGKDMNYAYGEDSSLIVMDHITTSWSNDIYYYRIWYCPHVIAINNSDDSTEKLVIVNGSSGEDYFTVDNGDIVVTNSAGTYFHEIKGFTNTVILPLKQTMAVSIPDTWNIDEENSTLSNGTKSMRYIGQVSFTIRPTSQPESTPASLPVLAADALDTFVSGDLSLATLLAVDHYQAWKTRQTQSQEMDDWLEEFESQALLELLMR